MVRTPIFCIDGMNLALPKGTGVASYARTLARALMAEGHPVSLLYGQALPGGAEAGAPERFLKGLRTDYRPPRPKPHEAAWWRETTHHLLGHDAKKIELDAALRAALPPCRALYNSQSLFRAAHGFFRTTGQFVKIRLPEPVDIMHWTYPVPIRAVGVRNVYTLHDLVPLLHPDMTLDRTTLYRKMLDKVVRCADALCTVSETSRQDIERLFPRSRGRVFNTYQAHEPDAAITVMSEADHAGIIHQQTGFAPGDYYIHYGQIEPKKNTARILQAFLATPTGRKLVLVGSTGWKNGEALALLEEGRRQGRVLHIPYLPDRELFTLLRGARALFFPSLVEGFGLPVLEAFTLGTPVLTSGHGALAEVAGDAALLVDPEDSAQIAQAMARLEADDALCHRLSVAGLERRAMFSLPAYQARLSRFYGQVMGLAADR